MVLLAAGLLAPDAAGQSRWKDITPPYYTDNERSYQSVHFTDELNGYAVGRPGRIIKTTDGGQTWTMKSLAPGTLYSIHFPTPTTGYAVGEGGGIFKTTDAGVTWQAQTLTTDVFDYNNYSYNVVHFVDANVGYIVADQFETGSLVLKTTNGGASWRSLPHPFSGQTNIEFQSRYFVNAAVGYVAGQRRDPVTKYFTGVVIIKTADGGASWTEQVHLLQNMMHSYVRSMHFINERNGYVAGSFDNGLIKTTDGGNTWTFVKGLLHGANSIDFTGNHLGIIAQPGAHILIIRDGANTWEREERDPYAGNIWFYDACIPSANRAYAVGNVVYTYIGPITTAPEALSLRAEGNSKSFAVAYPEGWTATADQDWITLDKTSGTGNATVSVTALPNPTGDIRRATITLTEVRATGVLTSTVTVTQAGTVPTLSVSPKTLFFPANASRLPVQIASNATTTLTSEQDWLDGPSGFENRTVEVFANMNPTGNTRTGRVIVRTGSLRDTIQVSQAPQPPSVYIQMNGVFDQPGGTATLTIECNSDWKITNPGEWFTFSTLSGRGNATVTVTAPANGSVYAKRTELTITAGEAGGATVASEPVLVYQHGEPMVFEASPAPSVVYWGADAQSSSFAITTNADWTATSDRPWLSVSLVAGTGTSTVTFSAPAHTGSSSRSTFVRIALPGLEQYKNFQLVQLPSYVSPTAVDFAAGGESKTVQINYLGSWSLSSTDPWLTITPASGSGPATVTLTATTNPAGTLRSGKVTARYTYAGGTPTQTLTVTQQGATLAVAPAALALPAVGESTDVTVSSNVSWRVSSAPAWLTVSPQTGTGNATLTLTAGANPSVDVRSDSLTLTAGTLTRKVALTQAGVPVELSTNSTALHFTAGGGSESVAVFCNTDWQVAGPLPGWLLASTTGGRGNDSLTLSASVNTSLHTRTHSLTLTARGETRTLSVSQNAAQPSLTISADTLLFLSAG